MADRFVKSAIWIASFGGVAYLLQLITTPSAEKIEKIKASSSRAHLTDEEKKKILLMKRLKEAATGQPIYSITKKD